MATQVLVNKTDLTRTQIADYDPGPLQDGAARLAVESFSVTANNVTYAVVGDAFGYWNFFPAGGDMGIVPLWGHARVVEEKGSGLAVGERVYGYLPMATHLDVMPGKVSAAGFTDIAEHRQPMSPIYNQYSRLAADPEHDPDREGERMIFGPLFKTGFLIEYFMRTESWFTARSVVVTSASSKTAMGLASVARRNSPDIERIGMTSPANVGFVRDSGLYDKVLSYDQIDALPPGASVSVDFAGNAKMLRAIHDRLGENLKYSCLVGATHIEERGSQAAAGKDLPGPEPTLFFAPDHAVALFRDLGPGKAAELLAQAWHGFLRDIGPAVTIERHRGLNAARLAFTEMVAGRVDPAKGIVVEP